MHDTRHGIGSEFRVILVDGTELTVQMPIPKEVNTILFSKNPEHIQIVAEAIEKAKKSITNHREVIKNSWQAALNEQKHGNS